MYTIAELLRSYFNLTFKSKRASAKIQGFAYLNFNLHLELLTTKQNSFFNLDQTTHVHIWRKCLLIDRAADQMCKGVLSLSSGH